MLKKMKVAFLIGEIHHSAGQTHNIAEIVKYLLSKHPDWEISVLTHKIYFPLIEGMNEGSVKMIKINRYYSAIFLQRELSSTLSDYDVIYVKGSFPYVFPAVRSGRPTILVVHHMDSIKSFKGFGPKLRVLAANLMTGYVVRKPDAVVTVSEELASFYNRKYGIKAHVIEDQISDAYFEQPVRTTPDKSKRTRLLTVGNWDGPNGRKRHDVLLRYLAEGIKAGPETRLSMVGLSDENLKVLSELTEEMQLKGYVTLKGFLDEKELVQEYVSNHIYVTATTYEGFYRQIVEAFATGMPAVVYDSSDVVGDPSKSAASNHVIKSGAGKLFKDSESFTKSIVDVMNDYGEYSARARKYALRYSSKVVGPKTESLLERVKYR